jgi:hypothetical protein
MISTSTYWQVIREKQIGASCRKTRLTRSWAACNWKAWKMLPNIFDEIDEVRTRLTVLIDVSS